MPATCTVTVIRARFRALAIVLVACLAAAPGPGGAALAQAPRTITLEVPRAGAVVAAPVEVRGRVTVGPFENNLRGRVYDRTGRVVGEGPVAVTPDVFGSLGGPGSFAARIPVAAGVTGPVRVEVADLSAADGSVLASASAEVVLGPVGLPATGAGPIPGWPFAAAIAVAALGLCTRTRRR